MFSLNQRCISFFQENRSTQLYTDASPSILQRTPDSSNEYGIQIVNETQESPSPRRHTPPTSAQVAQAGENGTGEFVVVDPKNFQRTSTPPYNRIQNQEEEEGEEKDEEEEDETEEDEDEEGGDDDEEEEDNEKSGEEEGSREESNLPNRNQEDQQQQQQQPVSQENPLEGIQEQEGDRQQNEGSDEDIIDEQSNSVETDIRKCQLEINLAVVALQKLRKVRAT